MSSRRPREVPVERDDEVLVDVVGLGDGPDGLTKFGDYVIFVPGVLPGEQARVRVSSAARKFGRGDVLDIEHESPDRVEPECMHFLTCGGCHWLHQSYPAQLRHKQERLQRSLGHALGERCPEVAPTVPAPFPFGQRHKVALHLRNGDRGLEACFHRARSPELVRIHECPASEPLAFALAKAAVLQLDGLHHRAWHPFLEPHGLLRSVLVRRTTLGEALLVLVARRPQIPGLERVMDALHAAGATTIVVNHNDGDLARLLGPHGEVVSGPPRVAERLCGTTYLISPNAFFQTSPPMAARLVQHVVDWLAPTPHDDVGDLYCGGGLLTLPLAARARSAFGIEQNAAAIADAVAASEANLLRNVRWRTGSVARWLAACGQGDLPRPQLVVMDPPRDGLEAGVVERLRALQPRRLAYVSCEPTALQRDLPALADAGFAVRSVVPFDMFPQTALVESLVCLERAR